MAADALRFPDAPAGLIRVNLAVIVLEMVVLTTGALRLFQRTAVGRWMVAITSGVLALHLMSASVQSLLTGGGPTMDEPASIAIFVICPLTAVVAAVAMIMALLPATGRWCLRQSAAQHRPSRR